jgi:hypothetical protein
MATPLFVTIYHDFIAAAHLEPLPTRILPGFSWGFAGRP